MKKLILLVALICVTTGAWAQETHAQRHAERVEEREAREAAYKKYVDSLILSHDYEFLPQTLQMETAGPQITLRQTGLYYIDVYPDRIEIQIPTIKGYSFPYRLAPLKFDALYPQNYTAVQEENGWNIKFSANAFDGNTYTFDLFVNYAGGEVSLRLSTPSYNTVNYTGFLRPEGSEAD